LFPDPSALAGLRKQELHWRLSRRLPQIFGKPFIEMYAFFRSRHHGDANSDIWSVTKTIGADRERRL
jgi:hypothetical protein